MLLQIYLADKLLHSFGLCSFILKPITFTLSSTLFVAQMISLQPLSASLLLYVLVGTFTKVFGYIEQFSNETILTV